MNLLLVLTLLTAGDNDLTDQEKKDGWILLFDGKSPEGWTNLKQANIQEDGLNPNKSGNYVTVTKEKFANFIISGTMPEKTDQQT